MTRTIPRLSLPVALLVSLGIVAAIAALMFWMGRLPICKCGYIKLWHGGRGDSEISQHLADWYTYSHVLHGVIFYFLLWFVFRGRLSVAARLVIATLIEGAWELFENTPFIINRYQDGGAATYTGDSIINSIGDLLAMMTGFGLTALLPVWATAALFVATEVTLYILIKNGFLLDFLGLLRGFLRI